MRTVHDVLAVAAVAVASGGAGWWAHTVAEARRMKRLVADSLDEIAGHTSR